MTRALQESSTNNRRDNSSAAIATRISNYKHNTLPVIGYYDDIDALYIVSTLGIMYQF